VDVNLATQISTASTQLFSFGIGDNDNNQKSTIPVAQVPNP